MSVPKTKTGRAVHEVQRLVTAAKEAERAGDLDEVCAIMLDVVEAAARASDAAAQEVDGGQNVTGPGATV
jgi:hypothetical protein